MDERVGMCVYRCVVFLKRMCVPIYANLKTLDQEDACMDINAFEKVLVQYCFQNYHRHNRLSSKKPAVLKEHDYNPPFMEFTLKQHTVRLINEACLGAVCTLGREEGH